MAWGFQSSCALTALLRMPAVWLRPPKKEKRSKAAGPNARPQFRSALEQVCLYGCLEVEPLLAVLPMLVQLVASVTVLQTQDALL